MEREVSAFVARVGSAAIEEMINRSNAGAELKALQASDPEAFAGLVDAVGRAAIASLVEPTPQMLAKVIPMIEFELTQDDVSLAEQSLEHLKPDAFPADVHIDGRAAALDLIRDWREMVKAALE